MNQNINVAIVGLGNIGCRLISQISEFYNDGIRIVATAEANPDAPGVAEARKRGIKVYSDENAILDLRENVDIIFELTGDKFIERSMRLIQVKEGNHHTVIVPSIMAQFIWKLLSKGEIDLGHNPAARVSGPVSRTDC